MMTRLVGSALAQRFITLILAALLTVSGIVAFQRLPIEGVGPYVREVRERFLKFQEVRTVVSQHGAPDDGNRTTSSSTWGCDRAKSGRRPRTRTS